VPTAALTLPARRKSKSLRRQFVAGGVALVAMASIAIGIASSVAVGRTLIEGLDEELADTARRLSVTLQQPDALPLNRPGFAVGTVVAILNGTEVSGVYIDYDGQLQALENNQMGGLRSINWERDTPVFVNLMEGKGEYRALPVVQVEGSQIVVGLPLSDIRVALARLNLIIVVVVTLVIAIGASIGAWLVRLALKPLDRIRETAFAVTEQPLDRGEVRLGLRIPARYATHDSEVGQVGAALNLMLDHVDEAFRSRFESEEKMRRFVADASHELRTPLAAIRGYAELTKRAGGALSPDLQHALDRIESESIRMTSLVEDLLLLARLDDALLCIKNP